MKRILIVVMVLMLAGTAWAAGKEVGGTVSSGWLEDFTALSALGNSSAVDLPYVARGGTCQFTTTGTQTNRQVMLQTRVSPSASWANVTAGTWTLQPAAGDQARNIMNIPSATGDRYYTGARINVWAGTVNATNTVTPYCIFPPAN